jgi:hypothetical protein
MLSKPTFIAGYRRCDAQRKTLFTKKRIPAVAASE